MNEKVIQQLREFIHILKTRGEMKAMYFFGDKLGKPIKGYIKETYSPPNWDDDTDLKMETIVVAIVNKVKKGVFKEPMDIINGLKDIVNPNFSPLPKKELVAMAIGRLGDICRELLTKMRIEITDENEVDFEQGTIKSIAYNLLTIKNNVKARELNLECLYGNYIVNVKEKKETVREETLYSSLRQQARRCSKQFIEEYNKIINNSISK